MAIAFVNVASGQNDGAASITISKTIAAGSDRILIVKTHAEANTTPANLPVTGITYGGVALTKAVEEIVMPFYFGDIREGP